MSRGNHAGDLQIDRELAETELEHCMAHARRRSPKVDKSEFGVTPEESDRAAREWFSRQSNLHEGRYA